MSKFITQLSRNLSTFLGAAAQSSISSGGAQVTGGEMNAVIAVRKFDGQLDAIDRSQLNKQFLANPDVDLSPSALDELLKALGLDGGNPFPIQPMYGVLIRDLTDAAKKSGNTARLDAVITAVEGALDATPSPELAPMTAFSTATSSAVSKRTEVESALAEAKAVRAAMD